MATMTHFVNGQESISTPINRLYRVPEAARILSLSRSVLYELIRSGRIRSVKEGAARFITSRAIEEYIELLENEAGTSERRVA